MPRVAGDRTGLTLSVTPEERSAIVAEMKAWGHTSSKSIIMHALNVLKESRVIKKSRKSE